MTEHSSNNKRIAKNTLLLYIRMMFTMAVALFTSRVVLNALGISDFGIYNVVGGFIAMFTVLSGSFSNAITRFITFELGKKDSQRLNAVFCTGVNIRLIMSVVIVIAAEIIGLGFLNYHMSIPDDRLNAAHWVLQCAIGAFVLNLISVPFNAEIIAHEEMGAYAVISIVNAVLQLIIAYMLYLSPLDKLKTYAVLYLVVAFIIRIIYGIYCRRKFEECTYYLLLDKDLFSEMGKFAGWNFLGSSAFMLNTQGVNMLMNIYFGVAANAARGIAVQVDSAVKSFANSFTTAINPQITKSYSAGELDYMYQLVCRGAKFSAFLFLFIAVPIVLETPTILKIWLKTVPEYTIVFVRLIVFSSFVDSLLGNSFWTAIMATGKIKGYQIVIAIVGVMVFPFSWLCFEFGCGPESTYIVYIIIYCIALLVRLYFMKVLLYMPLSYFFRDVLGRVAGVMLLTFIIPLPLLFVLDSGWIRLSVVCLCSLLVTSTVVYTIGLTQSEKVTITSKLKKIVQRFS